MPRFSNAFSSQLPVAWPWKLTVAPDLVANKSMPPQLRHPYSAQCIRALRADVPSKMHLSLSLVPLVFVSST